MYVLHGHKKLYDIVYDYESCDYTTLPLFMYRNRVYHVSWTDKHMEGQWYPDNVIIKRYEGE